MAVAAVLTSNTLVSSVLDDVEKCDCPTAKQLVVSIPSVRTAISHAAVETCNLDDQIESLRGDMSELKSTTTRALGLLQQFEANHALQARLFEANNAFQARQFEAHKTLLNAEIAQLRAELLAETVRRDAETVRRDAETVRRDAETVRRDAETVRRDAETAELRASLAALWIKKEELAKKERELKKTQKEVATKSKQELEAERQRAVQEAVGPLTREYEDELAKEEDTSADLRNQVQVLQTTVASAFNSITNVRRVSTLESVVPHIKKWPTREWYAGNYFVHGPVSVRVKSSQVDKSDGGRYLALTDDDGYCVDQKALLASLVVLLEIQGNYDEKFLEAARTWMEGVVDDNGEPAEEGTTRRVKYSDEQMTAAVRKWLNEYSTPDAGPSGSGSSAT